MLQGAEVGPFSQAAAVFLLVLPAAPGGVVLTRGAC